MTRALALLITISACQAESPLHRVCPATCYDGREGTEGVGQCKAGTPICDEDFNVIDCEGDVLPEWDKCDGVDNNCDGRTDEDQKPVPAPFFHYENENPCGPMHGECRYSEVVCGGAAGWICNHASTVEFGDETLCDNRDNDCDGRVDENILFACTDLLGNPAPCSCFEGPPEAANNRPCAAGVYECVRGATVCVGQILQTPEVCNLVDDDCNGVVDDTLETLDTDYDIVFIVDDSGSMEPRHVAVSGALDAYSAQFENNPHYRFALVDITDWTLTGVGYTKLLANFGDFTTLRNELLRLDASGNAHESTLDGPYWVCEESNVLGLTWRPEAQRLIFEFTDESPQAYSPSVAVTDQIVTDTCVAAGTSVYIWVPQVYQDYNGICQGTGGMCFPIRNAWQPMFDDLNMVIQDQCVDGT